MRGSALFGGDPHAAGIVPGTGILALLVAASAAATAFLAVAAICLGLAAGRLAERWAAELAHSATIRISGPAEELDARVEAALALLRATPGIVSARVLTADETAELLTPWLGTGLPLDALPVPRLIDVVETREGPDRTALSSWLAGQVPGAIYDDHARWRRPLVDAAAGLQRLALAAAGLTLFLTGTMVILAAQAALSANLGVITTLRLVGAADAFIIRAFVHRFTFRAFAGAALGTCAGALAVLALPGPGAGLGGADTALTASFRPEGAEWLALLPIPLVAAGAAWAGTRISAGRALRRLA